MAGNLNRVMLIGHLGRDPEVRYTKDGTAVANLRLATSEQWTDKAGEKQERTEWHTVVLWGRLAEIAEQYLQKGRLVFVEGRLETRKWQDQSGADRYSTEVKAQTLQMLGRGEGGERGSDRSTERDPADGERPNRGGGGGGRPASRPSSPPPDDMGPPPGEDDIPF